MYPDPTTSATVLLRAGSSVSTSFALLCFGYSYGVPASSRNLTAPFTRSISSSMSPMLSTASMASSAVTLSLFRRILSASEAAFSLTLAIFTRRERIDELLTSDSSPFMVLSNCARTSWDIILSENAEPIFPTSAASASILASSPSIFPSIEESPLPEDSRLFSSAAGVSSTVASMALSSFASSMRPSTGGAVKTVFERTTDIAHGTVSSYSSRPKDNGDGSSEKNPDPISHGFPVFPSTTAAHTSQSPMSRTSRTLIEYPDSSSDSRAAACADVSPSSTWPPGISHPPRRSL